MKNLRLLSMLLLIIIFSSCGENKDNIQESIENSDSTKIELSINNAITINSFQLIKEFEKDRAIAWEKYGQKTLLITDLLLQSVYIADNEVLPKRAYAYAYDPKTKEISAKGTRAGYFSRDDKKINYFFKNIELATPYKYKSSLFYIAFSNPYELKRINKEDFTVINDDNNYTEKVNIYCYLNDIEFKAGSDIKAYKVSFILSNVEFAINK